MTKLIFNAFNDSLTVAILNEVSMRTENIVHAIVPGIATVYMPQLTNYIEKL